MSHSSQNVITLFFLFLFLFLSFQTLNVTAICRKTCGGVSLRYPFGSDSGCGHPDFSRYIKCSSSAARAARAETLQLTTATGVYTVAAIDYAAATLTASDPLMSTCSSMQNSGGFGFDRASPFTVSDRNSLVLLGCSVTSPLFDPDQDLCDHGSGTRLCRGLYSCRAVSGLGLPQYGPPDTCCAYRRDSLTLVSPGSGFGLDPAKLQCSSYASVYEFVDEGDPTKWRFGISLEYNESYYTSECKDCEDSQGVCGFSGSDRAFACVCPNGINSTVNCFGRGYAWSGAMMGLEVQIKMSITGFVVWPLALLLLRS